MANIAAQPGDAGNEHGKSPFNARGSFATYNPTGSNLTSILQGQLFPSKLACWWLVGFFWFVWQLIYTTKQATG
jgi:hypothetical protein